MARPHRDARRADRDDGSGTTPGAGPRPRSLIKESIAKIKDDQITLTGAGVAFYWFLAVFPLMIAAVGIVALIHGESLLEGVRKGIETTLPSGAAKVLVDAISRGDAADAGGFVAVLIGIAIALFSASSGMVAVQEGLDKAYDVPESRKFVKKRAVGLALTLAALVLGGIATALLVFGKPLGEPLAEVMPLGGAFTTVWTVVRWVVTVLAVMTLFSIFYRIGPNRERAGSGWLSIGSVVAAVIWLAASLGFSFYVSSFGGIYAETYGSLAGVIVLLLWLFLSALALLIGGEVNAVLEGHRGTKTFPHWAEEAKSRRSA
jgi:membrane protein